MGRGSMGSRNVLAMSLAWTSDLVLALYSICLFSLIFFLLMLAPHFARPNRRVYAKSSMTLHTTALRSTRHLFSHSLTPVQIPVAGSLKYRVASAANSPKDCTVWPWRSTGFAPTNPPHGGKGKIQI